MERTLTTSKYLHLWNVCIEIITHWPILIGWKLHSGRVFWHFVRLIRNISIRLLFVNGQIHWCAVHLNICCSANFSKTNNVIYFLEAILTYFCRFVCFLRLKIIQKDNYAPASYFYWRFRIVLVDLPEFQRIEIFC